MQIPPGMTEAEVLDVIDKVARTVAKKIGAIAWFDREDLKQECYLWAIEALPRYDPATGPLASFLYTHCKNRALNLKRDTLRRVDPPCPVCHAHAEGTGPGHDDGHVCRAYERWRERNERKADLAAPQDTTNARERGDDKDDPARTAEVDEVLRLIDKELPLELRADWLALRDGVTLPQDHRQRLLKALRRILAKAGVEIPKWWRAA